MHSGRSRSTSSHVTRHTSHVTRHTSHVITRHSFTGECEFLSRQSTPAAVASSSNSNSSSSSSSSTASLPSHPAVDSFCKCAGLYRCDICLDFPTTPALQKARSSGFAPVRVGVCLTCGTVLQTSAVAVVSLASPSQLRRCSCFFSC